MLKALLDPMPRKLRGMGHLQHTYCENQQQAERTLKQFGVLDVRRVADARGILYALGARLVWLTPLALIAANLHRLPRFRGEALITEQPFRNPLRRFVVTRSLVTL